MEIELTIPTHTDQTKPTKKPKPKRPKKIGEEGNFINNSVLFPEVVKCKETGKVSNELAAMIVKMSTKYCSAKNFSHLPYKDDLVQTATLALLLNILKFKPEKGSNVFAYSTTIMYHSCLQYIAAETRQKNIRDRLIVDEGVNASLGFMEKEHDAFMERNADFFGIE